jgi:hypothetical protein
MQGIGRFMPKLTREEVIEKVKKGESLEGAVLAKFFGVSKQTVANYRYEGGLSYVKVGIKSFFIEADILQWLAKRRVDKTVQP